MRFLNFSFRQFYWKNTPMKNIENIVSSKDLLQNALTAFIQISYSSAFSETLLIETET